MVPEPWATLDRERDHRQGGWSPWTRITDNAGGAHPDRQIPTAAALGALGVVYGDIGTSPLYALKEAAKAAGGGGAPTPDAVLGVAVADPLVADPLVSLKYAILILRADNRGEGGILALLALLHARDAPPGSWRACLLVLGLIGAALLYGDGAITPAISVLSAVEGLKVDAPQLAAAASCRSPSSSCVGAVPRPAQGTGFIGGIFGPVMLLWFVVLGAPGPRRHRAGARRPARPSTRSTPSTFCCMRAPAVSFAVLGAVFLAVTGGEAMYADMGHFGRGPIRLAWFAVVLPGLVLNYFGQGALLLTDPAALENPFYLLAPDWAHYPLVGARDRGHGDRLAGDHLGRVLADPAGDPARLPAAHAHPPHRQPRARPDLRARW